MIWLLLALFATASAFWLLAPVLRRASAREIDGIGAFKSQLEELERDRGLGLIGEDEARAVEIEIKRRLLAAAESGAADFGAPSPRLRQFAVVLVGASLLAAMAFYLQTGRPDLTGPGAEALLAAPAVPAGMPGTPQEMVARLATRLQDNPDDPDGWAMLGRSLMTLGEPAAAAEALAQAAARAPDLPGVHLALGEARLFAAQGAITEGVRTAFEAALAQDPQDLRARFVLAEARYQDGDLSGALEDLRAQLAEAGAPLEGEAQDLTRYRALITRRIEMIEAELAGETD